MSTTISQAGGIVYIQQSGNSIQYQSNSTSGSWTNITLWPVTLTNTNPTSGTVLTVQLFTDITISATTVVTGTNGYFIMGSEYVTFDGDNKTVTISGVTGYLGLINNSSAPGGNGRANVTVRNVGVLSSSSTIATGAWICQTDFSTGVNNNFIINCYSSGIIPDRCGGICGYFAAASGGSLTISNCYSTGAITGFLSGGICGQQGAYSGGPLTITNCYSLGAITGQFAGGICGWQTGQNGGSVFITNCYSLGAIGGNSSGGICGAGAGNTNGSVTITNCYSYGIYATPTTPSLIPGIVGDNSVTTGISNYYVARGVWSDTTANASGALTGIPTSLYVNNPGTTWTTLATNTPYVLSGYNAQLYSPNSYINPSGYYTSSPGLFAGKTYSILSVNNAATPSSITIDSVGALTFNVPDARAVYNVKVLASQGTSPNYFGYNVNSFRLNQLCFKEGSKILCLNPETNSEEYIKIENLRKGDLVKTFLNGYKPISHIGYSKMYNKVDNERTKDKLYKCCKEEYPEIFEDLVITAAHSILIDDFASDEQKQKTIDVNGDTYVTERKYRLPACVDERAKIYEVEGEHMIYHLALEHEDYYKNYGVYANGLLVETSSNRMMVEYGMTLI